ncbi:MAG: hypothetical protein M1470_14025 [Bacteroidetes bacterium]|nr:hypothetical protein [Bacteroidota bacterium]MCL5738162.1 hypothetical protein [Bacteroidota bacterium]
MGHLLGQVEEPKLETVKILKNLLSTQTSIPGEAGMRAFMEFSEQAIQWRFLVNNGVLDLYSDYESKVTRLVERLYSGWQWFNLMCDTMPYYPDTGQNNWDQLRQAWELVRTHSARNTDGNVIRLSTDKDWPKDMFRKYMHKRIEEKHDYREYKTLYELRTLFREHVIWSLAEMRKQISHPDELEANISLLIKNKEIAQTQRRNDSMGKLEEVYVKIKGKGKSTDLIP